MSDSGYYDELPPHIAAARCVCGEQCHGSLADVNAWAMRHDDSPWHRHVVSWAGAGRRWPNDAAELAKAAWS